MLVCFALALGGGLVGFPAHNRNHGVVFRALLGSVRDKAPAAKIHDALSAMVGGGAILAVGARRRRSRRTRGLCDGGDGGGDGGGGEDAPHFVHFVALPKRLERLAEVRPSFFGPVVFGETSGGVGRRQARQSVRCDRRHVVYAKGGGVARGTNPATYRGALLSKSCRPR